MKRLIFILAMLISSASFVHAADPPSNEEVEIRAREVGRAIRCVVCQNQSIEDSDAVLASDMRQLVRNRIQSGDSNAEVIEFMHERYGDFVLLKPPVQSNTYILWGAPFVLLLVFFAWYLTRTRKNEIGSVDALSDDEQQVWDELTSDKRNDS